MDLLDKLDNEKYSGQKKLKVKPKELNEAVGQAYLELVELYYDHQYHICYENYEHFLEYLPKDYSAKDIEDFSININGYLKNNYPKWFFEHKISVITGIYLSALCNNCKDDQITIHTRFYNGFIEELGLYNEKNIIINGDVGNWFGSRSKKGILELNGNALRNVGYSMDGGKIIINGNCESLGGEMANGEIIVNGNVVNDAYVGNGMHDGYIAIYGDAGRICGMGGLIEVFGSCKWMCCCSTNVIRVGKTPTVRFVNSMLLRFARMCYKTIGLEL